MNQGIQETKEAVVGLIKLSAELAKLFKDGVQAADAMALVAKYNSDGDFKAAMDAAYQNIQAIPEEVKDLDLVEGIDLGMAVLKEVPALVAALK